jgi:tetraacyldisaccharide 4'-kinase
MIKSVLAGVFGAAVGVRSAMYDRGWLSIERAPVPVISVGNLAVGGSGKTPFVILLAKKLLARGEKPAIISRGYGALSPPKPPALVPPGGDPRIYGDEPILLAQKLAAEVFVSPKRIEGARLASERGATVLLLDDGFQHRALHRELDLVLLDAADPFAGGLLPKGRLREPRSALLRAHLLVLIESQGVNEAKGEAGDLSERPVIRARVEAVPGQNLHGKKVALLAAIARPERFRRTVEQLGAHVVWAKFFADHAYFDPQEAIDTAKKHGAELILTTEKDHARAPHPELVPLPIEHLITDGETLLDRELDRLLGGSRP